MTVIGITGPTGAGKTTVLKEIEALGARSSTAMPCTTKCWKVIEPYRKAWRGPLAPPGRTGAIDRKKLGALVFGDPAKLERLNAIAQRAVVQRTRQMVKENRSRGIGLTAIDAFALLESGLADLCTTTVAVLAPAEARVARIMAREGISEDYAWARVRGPAAGPVLCGRAVPISCTTTAAPRRSFPGRQRSFERDRVGAHSVRRARHNKRTMRRAKRPCEIKGGLFYE